MTLRVMNQKYQEDYDIDEQARLEMDAICAMHRTKLKGDNWMVADAIARALDVGCRAARRDVERTCWLFRWKYRFMQWLNLKTTYEQDMIVFNKFRAKQAEQAHEN